MVTPREVNYSTMFNKKKRKKRSIQISRKLRDILYGYIMSNDWINQSTKQKRLFVKWLYKKFRIPLEHTRDICKSFRNMWYKPRMNIQKKRKSLPSTIACFFSIPFVTVWFAGSGTKIIGQRSIKFEVTYWTPEERLLLKHLFKTQFNINGRILRAGVSKWILVISGKEYSKFRTLLTQMDLIPRFFPHKLYKK
nr:LAGLIDADG homing endonuclease [Rhipidosiphon lewmanomontiae]